MESVAVEAGVGKPALYRRWPTKAALAFAATVDASVPDEVPDLGSFGDDLRALLGALADSLEDVPREAIADQLGAMIVDRRFSEEVQRRETDPRRRRVHQIWQRAVARGEVDPAIDGDELLFDLASVVLMRALVYHRHLDRTDRERLATAVERLTRPPTSA